MAYLTFRSVGFWVGTLDYCSLYGNCQTDSGVRKRHLVAIETALHSWFAMERKDNHSHRWFQCGYMRAIVGIWWEHIHLAFQLRSQSENRFICVIIVSAHVHACAPHIRQGSREWCQAMRFIIFLTYSSYIEAYEVRKIKQQSAKTRRRYHHSWIPDERKQRSQLLWVLCQQQRPVTNAGHANKKKRKRQTTVVGALYWKKKKDTQKNGAITVVRAELISNFLQKGGEKE